jgi:polygalacturonase
MKIKDKLRRCVILFIATEILDFSSVMASSSLVNEKGYYNITAFDATGDGMSKDTHAIQAAVDSCAHQGGGTVYFPAGTFLCGSIHLKSNVALYFDHGCILLMSKDNEDFDKYETLNFKNAADKETSFFHYALIWGEDIEHIAILGTGIIDCNREKRGGPKPIALKRCRDVTIKDITIRNAPNYNISLLGTDFVRISGVSIQNGYCDGIDPDCCKNVMISDCFIDCFDDAIVPKSSFSLGERRSTENLTVTNCQLASNCNAFKFGTESGGGFKNVAVSNCVIFKRKTGKMADSGIALESVDGAEIEGITISNISMTNVISPIFIRLGNRGRDLETPIPGFLRDVFISNITVTGAAQTCMVLGIPGHPVENVVFDNIRISFSGGGRQKVKFDEMPELISKYPDSDMFGELPAWGFWCRHCRNLKMVDMALTVKNQDQRNALIFHDVEKLDIASIYTGPADNQVPPLCFKDVRDATIRGCRIPEELINFIDVPRNEKNEVHFIDNTKIQKQIR